MNKETLKDQRKQLQNLERISSKILGAYSFHQIRTLNDLLRFSGYNQQDIDSKWFPSERSKVLSRNDVLEYLSDRKIELTTKHWLENNPPQINNNYESNTTYTIQHENSSTQINAGELSNKDYKSREYKQRNDLDRGKIIEAIQKSKQEALNFIKLPSIPQETYFAIHQKKAIISLDDGLFNKHLRGQYLIGQGGSGKTWVFGYIFRKALDINFKKQIASISPWPYILVTKAQVVEKTTRDLRRYFNIKVPQEVLVIGIDQLRSKFGELFVQEETIVEDGVERVSYRWRPMIYPCLVVWDEGHILKNYSSIQHHIACSFNELPNTYQIFSSATPLSKVAEGKCFAVATRHISNIASIQPTELTNELWSVFARNIAAPASPLEYAPEAVKRFRTEMNPYIVEMSNVRPQFHAKNSVKLIPFTTDEGKKYYNDAEEKMIQRLQKIKNNDKLDGSQKYLHQFTAMLAYRIAAESNPNMISYICENIYEDVYIHGKAAVIAVCFKETLIRCVKYLVYKKKVPRSLISVIWGGGIKKVSDKQKAKHTIVTDPEIQAMLDKMGISVDDLGLEDVEAKMEQEDLPEELELGVMTKARRQKEIDRFQLGKTLFCFYTFRAGGTGLSLHHTDEFTNQWNEAKEGFAHWRSSHKDLVPGKVRRKESGYAYEEDIPFIPTRQRKTRICPTWSPPELVQGVCRAPRLTSLSDTEQELIFFKNTIQEKVAHKSSLGLASLSKMVRQNESWIGFAVGEALNYIDKTETTDEDIEEEVGDAFLEESEETNEKENNPSNS